MYDLELITMQKECYPLDDFISNSKYVKLYFNNKWRFL